MVENNYSQDKLDKANVFAELARRAWAGRDYAKAQEYYLLSLKLLESEFGSDQLALVPVLHDLGLLSRVRVRYDESEKYYIRALKICELKLGPEALGTATRLNYLAGLYNAQAEFQSAELLLLRSLSIYKAQLGEVNQQVALILMALAILAKRQLKEADAKAYREQMHKINAELMRIDDVKVALSKLADFFYTQGRLDDADLVFRYGLILGEEQEFPQHPFVAESLLGLARLYADYEAWPESISLYERSIDAWDKLSVGEGSELKAALLEYAALLRKLKRTTEADLLDKRAEQIKGT